MFTSAVVLDAAVSTIYSATSYYSLLVQYAVFFRVLPCVIAASVYYAVFFRVRLLLSACYDSLVPDPGSRSRLQRCERSGSNIVHTLVHLHRRYYACTTFAQRLTYNNMTAVLRGVSVL